MIKQFLLLVAIVAIVLAALLGSLYVLDLLKLADLQSDLRKLLGVMAIAAASGVVIMLLTKAGQKQNK